MYMKTRVASFMFVDMYYSTLAYVICIFHNGGIYYISWLITFMWLILLFATLLYCHRNKL